MKRTESIVEIDDIVKDIAIGRKRQRETEAGDDKDNLLDTWTAKRPRLDNEADALCAEMKPAPVEQTEDETEQLKRLLEASVMPRPTEESKHAD